MQKESLQRRKEDTRKKIMLRGLIIKAGLDYMHKDEAYILYGMLLDFKDQLQETPEIKEHWKVLGKGLLVGLNERVDEKTCG